MLGAFAVGKTSLVQRFVNSIFSEKYHTTIGVKIDQKMLELQGKKINLILWDIHGEDEFQTVKSSYLIGAAGYFLVLDGTRKNTIDIAESLHKNAKQTTDNAPFIALINKSDLKSQWEINTDHIKKLKDRGWYVLETSAKEDVAVEKAFIDLATLMIS